MTKQLHPISPPPKLVEQWFDNSPIDRGLTLAIQAAQWGADMELEACVEWLDKGLMTSYVAIRLRSDRRPKPPSLKDQALQVLASAPGPDYPSVMTVLNADEHALIRQALEALPND